MKSDLTAILYQNLDRSSLLEVLSWRNHEKIRVWMVNPGIISEQEHFSFVDQLKLCSDRLFWRFNDDDGAGLGGFNLVDIDHDEHSASLGIL
ncbi:MAG: hypothetical protein R3B45_14155 [Bdellovibrionota bacterium]